MSSGSLKLREKCLSPSYSVLYFPAFGQNKERYQVFLRIRYQCGKIQTRITSNMDTFYAVLFRLKLRPLSRMSEQNSLKIIEQSVLIGIITNSKGLELRGTSASIFPINCFCFSIFQLLFSVNHFMDSKIWFFPLPMKHLFVKQNRTLKSCFFHQ